MSVAISIENVIKRFGKDTIINGLSLDVRPGEFFTLLAGTIRMRQNHPAAHDYRIQFH